MGAKLAVIETELTLQDSRLIVVDGYSIAGVGFAPIRYRGRY